MTSRSRFSLSFAALLSAGAACAFWVPALPSGRGFFPAPLDDVYIHFDFARSLAGGHPFEWIPGQGYSSGETAPLYAFLLAVGYLVGFRGALLGVWAALLAIAGVAKLVASVRTLAHPCPAWLAWLVALFPLAIGLVGWSLWSGMEIATLSGALGGALLALDRARRTTQGHARTEWRLGLWGAALVLLRPEAAVVVAVFALVAARGSGTRSALATIARVATPGAAATGALLLLNWAMAGDPRHAGAQLKLLSSNPYLSEVDRARTFVENLIVFYAKAWRLELAAHPVLTLAWPALAVAGVAFGGRRPVAAACVLSSIAWMLLASWNGNAPYHNFRYYAPALVLLAIAAALGVAAIGRRWRVAGAVIALGTIASGAVRIPKQSRYFLRAATNVREQHVEVGRRIALLPDGARVLLGDAGAIPYVSKRAAIDALGLGGYRGLPFARAAVHGEPATIELIERLEPAQRPTHLALYPNWFRATTSRFGREIDRVTIADNVITGGPTKAIYVADWSSLDVGRDGTALDEIDVADVVSERDHAYVSPAPYGGWTLLDILVDTKGARRFDGGRIIPEGKQESFVTKAEGTVLLRIRTDGSARAARAAGTELVFSPVASGAWREATATIRISRGERITIEAVSGELHDFHVWLFR